MLNFGIENNMCEFKTKAIDIKIKDQTSDDFFVLNGKRLKNEPGVDITVMYRSKHKNVIKNPLE